LQKPEVYESEEVRDSGIDVRFEVTAPNSNSILSEEISNFCYTFAAGFLPALLFQAW